MNKPHVTTEAHGDELRHVLRIDGQPFEYFTSLRQAICALALVLALSGCTFCRENRAVCVAGGAMVLEGVVAASADHRGTVHSFAPAICSSKPESCR